MDRGIEALFQAAIEALPRLLAEIPNEVRRNNGLNVGRQSAPARVKVEIVVREVHLDAAVDELTEVRPVAEVPSAPIDLVDHNAARLSVRKTTEHLCEQWTTPRCGRLPFLKPGRNGEVVVRGVALDGIALLLEGHAAYTLLWRGDPNVSEDLWDGRVDEEPRPLGGISWYRSGSFCVNAALGIQWGSVLRRVQSLVDAEGQREIAVQVLLRFRTLMFRERRVEVGNRRCWSRVRVSSGHEEHDRASYI